MGTPTKFLGMEFSHTADMLCRSGTIRAVPNREVALPKYQTSYESTNMNYYLTVTTFQIRQPTLSRRLQKLLEDSRKLHRSSRPNVLALGHESACIVTVEVIKDAIW